MNQIKQVDWWKTTRAKRVGVISSLCAISILLIWFFYYRPYVRTDDARVSMTFIKVAPETGGGKIEKVAVFEGSKVKKNEVLVELDHRITSAQLMKAKAKYLLTQKELKRVRELAAQNGAPVRDLDKAESEAMMAEADLKLAQTSYDNTFLKSSIDGVIVQKMADVGNMLEQGQVALTVADVDHAWISANIEETYIGSVKEGQKVDVKIDEGGTLTGTVAEVRKAVASQFALIPSDNAAGNFTKLVQRVPVKISLNPHKEQLLRAGQSVIIKIHVR